MSKAKPIGFYEREALSCKRYGSVSFWERRYHTKRMGYVISRIGRHGDLFLDVGCGSGEYLKYASEAGSKCVGIDISVNYLKIAKEKCPVADFVRADIRMLPLRDSCADVTLCSEVLEHVSNLTEAVAELKRATKRNLIITTPNFGLARIILKAVSAKKLRELDESVGHVSIANIREMRKLFQDHKCRIVKSKTLNILPPIIGEKLRLPRFLSHVLTLFERLANIMLPNLGNILLLVVEKHTMNINSCYRR